jgi:hypothetical protein
MSGGKVEVTSLDYIPPCNWFAKRKCGITVRTKWLKDKPFLFQYTGTCFLKQLLIGIFY